MIWQQVAEMYYHVSQVLVEAYLAWGRPMLDIMHVVFDHIFHIILVVAVLFSLLYYVMVLSSFSRKKTHAYTFLPENAPFVTVQIPTYNELAALRCAERCLAFAYPKDRYEILIGDDSSDVEVSKKIAAFAAQHDMVHVHKRAINEGFKPGNLNNMLKHTKGDYIVIFDSDFLPEHDFLSRIIAPFQHRSDLSVVQARWKILDCNKNIVSVLGATMSKVFHYLFMPFIQRLGKVSFLCGSAEAIRTADLKEIGGWASGSLTEDIEGSIRLHLLGKKFLYLEDLHCDSEVPYTTFDLCKQQMRWSYGVMHSFRKHGKTLLKANMSVKQRLCIFLFASGYGFSSMLFLLFMFGVLSFVTHPPGPVDLPLFFTELVRNIVLTSGLVVASFVAIFKDKNIRRVDKMLAASFSVGLVVVYYVNVGIFKVLFNQPMQWHMLKKQGNEALS